MIIFIPIKKESQRVPGKNFREFRGVPLYKHTLLKLKKFNRVFVDTDCDVLIKTIENDEELKHVIPFNRNKELIGHDVSVVKLIRSFIQRFEIKNNEIICQLHVTTPLLDVDDLSFAKLQMVKNDYDSIISCNIHQTRLWRKEKYGYCPINHNPMKLEQTQDLPKIYEENSVFYMFKPEIINKYNSRVGVKPNFYPINFPENLDIDTESDWELIKNNFEQWD